MTTKPKKPEGWYSKAAKQARSDEKAARRREKAHREALEGQARTSEAKRVQSAKAAATAVVDKRTAGWAAAGKRWNEERVLEDREAKKRRRRDKERKVDFLPNRMVEPKRAVTPTGEVVVVDEVSGRFNLMMKRSGWPRELASACQRFEKDYASAVYAGMQGQSYDPKVDGGVGGASTAHVEAAARLRALRAYMGNEEEWGILCLWGGCGFTITDLHAKHIGVKDELGRLLRHAATKAAAFYSNSKLANEESDRLRRMRELLNEALEGVKV